MVILDIQPVFIYTGIIVLGFVIFIGFKILNEFRLNNLLKRKQKQMRIEVNHTHFRKRVGILGSTALAPVIVLVFAFALSLASPSTNLNNLKNIHSSQDILDIIAEFNQNSSYARYDLVENGVPESAVDDGLGIEDEGSDDYSETNVQVQGVDEMDNVITDGKYIYQMLYNQVYITLAYTQSQETNALSNYKVLSYIDDETNCPSGMYVTGLYVDDDYLIVIGSEYQYTCSVDPNDDIIEPYYYDNWYGYNNNVKVFVYDKNNDFELSQTYDLSGSLIGTRKIDDQIFIITNASVPFSEEDINLDNYLPYYNINDVTYNAAYEDIIYVEGTNPNSFINFFSIDLEQEAIDMEVVLGDNGYNLYVSHNSIYLVGNIYEYIIESDSMTYEPQSSIQKVSIDGADIEFSAVTKISGYTLNQFSMDEYNNYLRIATTSGWWGEDINNRVYILNEDLEEVSKLENLGKPGETIRSVRFVGDYGYVVTFEQTDPFYVINLSNPEIPYIEGELEIPGFSTYLQPLNDTYMLGIGFGDSNGGTNGLKISIYDISDKTNPKGFDEVIFDYADFAWNWSSATYNHKDLLINLNKGIIALPFSTYDYDSVEGYIYNSGILVFNFDEVNGLTKSVFITHDQNTDEEIYIYKIKFIDQYFYTISNTYIKASLISDPETIINSVTLPAYDYGVNTDETID